MIFQKKKGLRRPRKRHFPKRRKKLDGLNKQGSFKTWLLAGLTVVALSVLLFTGSVVLGYNPFLEGHLQSQFGVDFFADFNKLPERDNGESLEEIIDNYEPAFEALEEKASMRLDLLFQEALAEYRDGKGKGTVDRFMLTNKYIQAGRMLEENVDETFYDLLEEMENELNRKGYPTEILEEIETTYEQAKDLKKRELMNRLQQAVSR
ncbi:MAG: hypothetical protein ACQES4_04100 [Bacillota bacterium]